MNKDTTNQNLKIEKSLSQRENISLDMASSIINNTSDAITAINLKGEILFWNDGAAKLSGYSREEVLGKNISLLYRKQDIPDLVERIKKAKQGEFFTNKELIMIDKNGKEHTVLLTLDGLKDNAGNIATLVGVVKDITDLKHTERILQDSEQRFHQAFDNSPIPISILNLKTGKRLAANNSFCKTFGYTEEDLLNEENFLKNNIAVDQKEFRSIFKKILNEGTVFEHPFSMYTKSGEIRETLVNATRVNPDNKDVYIASFLDVTDRKIAENALLSSEKKFRNLAETAQVAIAILEEPPGSRFLYVNPYWENLTGYSSKEAEKLSAKDLIAPEFHKVLSKEAIESLSMGKATERTEFKIITKSGEIKWIKFTANNIDYGGVKAVLRTGLDITEQKNAEQELLLSKENAERSEIYLDRIINNIGDPVFVKDEESKFLLVNDSFCEFLDLTRKEIIGNTLAEDISPKEQEIFLRIDKQVIETGKENLNEETITVRGGETKIIITKKTRYIDGNGKKHLIGVIRDITDRKKDEEVRLETLSRLSLAVNTAKLGVWSRDAETDELFWNDRLFEIYGISPDEFESNMDSYFDRLHPDDRDYINEVLGSLYEGEPLHDVKFRIIRPDNEIRYIDSSAAPLVVNGRIEKYIGINRDITVQKIAEEKLYESEKVLKAIFDHHFQLTGLLDPKGKILAVNQTALNFIGKKEDEVIEKYFWDTPWWESSQKEMVKSAIDSAAKGQFMRFETTNINRIGEKSFIDFSLNPVFDDVGNIIYIVPEGRDISDRKIAEEKIKESEEKYRSLFEQSMIGIGMARGNEVVFGNKAMMALWKYDSLEDYKKIPLIEHIAPDSRELIKNRIKDGLANKGKNLPSEYEYNILCKDGEIRTVRGHTTYMQIGKETYAQTVVMDVTEAKRAEEKIKASEESISAILNSIKESVCVINDKGQILMVNDPWIEFGESYQSKNSKPIPHTDYNYFDICRADLQNKDAQAVLEGLLGLLQENTEAFRYEYPCHSPDKKQWFLLRADLMKTKEKQIVISHMDITDRKLSEEKTIETLAQLNLAVNTAKLGVWSHNIKTGELVWNNELFKTFGIKPSEFDYSMESFKKMVHPEDLDFLMKQQEKVFQSKTISGINYRIIRPSGEVRYIYASATPAYDNKDNLIKIIGINLDITKSKKAEKKLAQANAELIDAVSSLNELKKQLQDQNIYLKRELDLVFNFEEMVYGSALFSEVLTDLERVAPTDATVLILGESGTGKELLARALHNLSLRKDKPLIKVNCSAIPSELIESELFGHKKGSFTGAVSDKVGKFELADGGTLFLDEIGDLPLAMQPKLLRFLQEGEMEVVGGTNTKSLDVRIVAATNKDLKKEVNKEQFREDLYFRLNVFPLKVPPLRKRKEDIPLLVEHFCNKFGKKYRKNVKYISDSAMQGLTKHSWPGNIRELENLIERSVILSDSETLNLPGFGSQNNKKSRINKGANLTLNEVQRTHILSVLEKTNWKIDGKDGAAKILDLKPSTFRDKMKKLGIKRPD